MGKEEREPARSPVHGTSERDGEVRGKRDGIYRMAEIRRSLSREELTIAIMIFLDLHHVGSTEFIMIG